MSQKIDILNIGLIVLSLFLAILLPIKLFLFSYAVLGPLHYMTEIGWLDKRSYFSQNKRDMWILAVVAIVLTIGFLLSQISFVMPSYVQGANPELDKLIDITADLGGGVLFFSFVSAFAFVYAKDKRWRYITLAIGAVLSLFVHTMKPMFVLFGVLLPSIIHVSLFTALFMLLGALKSKSKAGYISVVLFIGCCIGIFFFDFDPERLTSTTDNFQMLLDSTFIHIGAILAEFIGLMESGDDYMLLTNLGLQIQTLFAFAYTYHYLNWFSKTKVINWHEVSPKWLILTASVWILSIVLYAINYKLGFLALFFLSTLHVLFEFPLNGLSIMGIAGEVKKRLSTANS